MIIWSGLGILVAVVVFLCLLFVQMAFDHIWGDGYYSNHSWTIAMGLLVSAPVVWGASKLIRRFTSKWIVDEATGDVILQETMEHDLFFIPIRYWGAVLAVGAAVLFVAELF